jgi:hypothetical protein
MPWIERGEWPHTCKKPGLWERFFMRCKPDALWQCEECDQLWKWRRQWSDHALSWHRTYPKSTVEPPTGRAGASDVQ